MTERVQPRLLDSATLLTLPLKGVKLIEASAGTGKTHTIADLYLRQVLAGHRPAQILIVTYTNAATEELRGRIRKRLYQAANCFSDAECAAGDYFLQRLRAHWRALDEDERERQLARLQFALRSMDAAAISTIHGFCQRVLQENALSGGQFFDSETLASDDPLWEAALKDWWRKQTYAVDEDSWRLLRAHLPQLDKLKKTLLELRNRPGVRLLPTAAPGDSDLLEPLRALACELHRLAPLWQQHRDRIIDIVSHSSDLSRARTLPYHADNLAALFAAADDFFAADASRLPFEDFSFLAAAQLYRHSKPKSRGKDADLQHPFFVALDPIADTWLEFSATLAPRLKMSALYSATHQVAREKRDMAVLAFQDQLTHLLDALEGDGGNRLAARIRQQYPVAMIDEFQDTDDIQYRIFDRIYREDDSISLTLIGDPKQAIYSFRGGDVFTYMRARHRSDVELFELGINWRSQPDLVAAVNTLFTHRADAFIYADSIAFTPVAAVAENARQRLQTDAGATSALNIWRLPQQADGKNYSRQQMRALINRAIAAEIAALLEQRACIDERPIEGGDIAILVRQTNEGHALARVLQEHGINTVTVGRDSVYASDEAQGLYDLLLAISQQQDTGIAMRSLGSSLLGLDYAQIAAVVDDDDRRQEWIEKLGRLQQVWQRQGFIPMFQALLQEFAISTRLARRDNSERRITNLLHLAELLQQQAGASAGMAPLMNWFLQQFDEPAHEQAELRLEGDEALVKIVTIHKSKGLQYPIVFVPFLWSCRQAERNGVVYFHDAEMRPCVDLGSADIDANWLRAEKERLAEDLRLLYVALTRAQSRVYLAWGPAGEAGRAGYADRTALAYLLHSLQLPPDLDQAAPTGFPQAMNFDADLQRLVDASDGAIELTDLPPASDAPLQRDAATTAALELAHFSRTDLANWRINSFTGLTRGIHQPAHGGSLVSENDPILDFPAGSHIGVMLHALLERLDFQQAIGAQCEKLFADLLPGAGIFGDRERGVLVDWLQKIVATRLDDDGLSLDRISNARRLNELEFDFALDHLEIEALNRMLQSLTSQPLIPISAADFDGIINGVIDLVFEHRGRYYLADYKSNFLGTSLDDYRPQNLQQAIWQRRYDLQSLLYSVALHRYLQQRLPDYDYDTHFGGSYYLFLRALRPETGCSRGVYYHRPDTDTMRALDALFGYRRAGEAVHE